MTQHEQPRRTAAATETRMKRVDERCVERLRSRGYVVLPAGDGRTEQDLEAAARWVHSTGMAYVVFTT